jgi:DNA-binding Lrp family transcriptional regulator
LYNCKINTLDTIDIKLLDYLDQNARISVTKLAHELGVSKQVISFRLKRLEKKNIIQEYSTYIDRAKLGFQHYQLYIKLGNYNKMDLYRDLSQIPHIHWCASAQGEFDIVIYFLTGNQADCYEAYNTILSTFSRHITNKEYLVTAQSHYFNQSAITYIQKKEVMVQKPQKRPRLKAVDFNLINLIKTNARVSIAEISREIGLSPRTIRDRLKYLRKVGVIKDFRIRLNYANLGYSHYQLLFETMAVSENEKKQLISQLLLRPQVIRLTQTLGKWELSADVVIHRKMPIKNWISKNLDQDILPQIGISQIKIDQVINVNTSIYL